MLKILFVTFAVVPVVVVWWSDHAATQNLQSHISQLEKDAKTQATEYSRLASQYEKMTVKAQDLQIGMLELRDRFDKQSIVAKHGENAWGKLEQATFAFSNGDTITAKEIIAAKRAFDDIQGEVATGKLRDLALMNSYQTLQKVLDSPSVENLASLGPGEQ